MPTKIILIRHGETLWNLRKRYCGFIDASLNNKGKSQAAYLRSKLKGEKVHKVYSSDRKRAIQTAKIIFKDLEIEKIPDLREMHFGVFEGLTHREITKKYPGIYKKWLDEPFSVLIPAAEDLNSFKRRVVSVFKKIILLNHNKTIAVVCHGGTIGMFICNILKTKDFWKYMPSSGSLSIVEYKDGKSKIRLLNDVSHLS